MQRVSAQGHRGGVVPVLAALGALLGLLLAARPAACAPAAPAVTVRLFIDSECPHSRKAWPRYREAVAALGADAQLLVHHVPASRHVQAQVAAQAAWVARQHGKELAFLDSLMAAAQPDTAAIEAAAAASDLPSADLARALAGAAAPITTERQAALAFGVQATPSALINGVGLGGVPEPAVLLRTLRRAHRQAAGRQDPERVGLLQTAADFLPALDALREARGAGGQGVAPASGELGPRSRLAVSPADWVWGDEGARVDAVALVDPALPWSLIETAKLLEAARQNRDMRVAVKPVSAEQLRDAGRPAAGGVALLAAAMATAQTAAATAAVHELLVAGGPWTVSRVETALSQRGLDVARLRVAATQPATSVWLHGHRETALRSAGQPGRIYLNGRVWWGRVGERGWSEAVAAAARETRQLLDQGDSAAVARQRLLASAIWRSDEELDLSEFHITDDLMGWPAVGHGGVAVRLLVDPTSFASRAAWVMLQRLARQLPIRLQVALVPRVSDRVASAFFAAVACDKWSAALDHLFAARDVARAAEGLAAVLGVPPARWKAAAAVRPGWRSAVAALMQDADTYDEPLILIGSRLYSGPLDEARLERAICRGAQLPGHMHGGCGRAN